MIPDENHSNGHKDIMTLVTEYGIQNLLPIMEKLLNEAMKIERESALKAKPYERTDDRQGYANGFKSRGFRGRCGTMRIRIPQVRGMLFYPKCLDKGDRTEKALKLAVAEMYIQGVSTRKVAAITEELCGFEISSTEVSRCVQQLDPELEKFRNRPLEKSYPYVYLDAMYEKIRRDGTVVDMAILVAIGVDQEGNREILGLSAKLSEAEPHWRSFFESLLLRGLKGVELFISDSHSGMRAARKAVFPSVKWQRCQFHMAQNAQAYAPKKSMKEEIATAVRMIFDSPDYDTAQEQKNKVISKYKDSAPEFVKWVEENIDDGLAIFNFPKRHQIRIRTTNGLERLNREIRRRTRVCTLFPSVSSCERLITAILQGIHEEWISCKRYLDMSLLQE